MPICNICGHETDVGCIVNGFYCCDIECCNVANEPNNIDFIIKCNKMGYYPL